jgi:hypothetical protein
MPDAGYQCPGTGIRVVGSEESQIEMTSINRLKSYFAIVGGIRSLLEKQKTSHVLSEDFSFQNRPPMDATYHAARTAGYVRSMAAWCGPGAAARICP